MGKQKSMLCPLVFLHTFASKVKKEESKVTLQINVISCLQLPYRLTSDNTLFAHVQTPCVFFSNLMNRQRLVDEGNVLHTANSTAKPLLEGLKQKNTPFLFCQFCTYSILCKISLEKYFET